MLPTQVSTMASGTMAPTMACDTRTTQPSAYHRGVILTPWVMARALGLGVLPPPQE